MQDMAHNGTPAKASPLIPALLALGMAVTVGSALAFEHIGGYIPCALCLLQRQPYYYGIPLAILATLNARFGGPAWVTKLLVAAVAVLMVVGAGMGVYHSGVEWHFWEGPATCATSANGVTQDASDLLNDLNAVKGPSCTEAALRVLGLSFAGWNVITSLLLAGIAISGLKRQA